MGPIDIALLLCLVAAIRSNFFSSIRRLIVTFLTLTPWRLARSLAAAASLFASPLTLIAQGPPSTTVPQVVTTATGEATIVPDRGMVYFAVETRAATAAEAGSENARRQSAVITAIRSKGVRGEQVTTSGYTVGPEERYDGGQRKLIGYIARNTVVVDVHKIDQLGGIIDAALGAGANSIGGLRYYSTRFEEARRSALRSAVTKARADAEVMASAAGGAIGLPLEISASDVGIPRPMYDVALAARAMEGGPETPISVGEQKVTVSVTARWAFLQRE